MKIKLKLRPKATIYLLLIVLAPCLGLQQVVAQDYCFPTYSPQGNSWRITEFSIPEISYSINISSWNQTDNTSELLMLTPGEEYTFQVTTMGWVGVGVAADFNNDTDFDDDAEILATPTYIASSPATYNYTITIPEDTSDGSYRLRLWNALANAGDGSPLGSPCGAYAYGTYADFTLIVGTCFPPLDIQITDIGQNQATVNWTEFGSAELWNVEYGESGFELGEGTLVTDLDTESYQILDLEIDTSYDVYVQSNCGEDDLSGWTGPISFETHFITVPIEIIGFNYDVIANGIGEMTSSTTNIVDNDRFCFLSENWKLDEGDPDITTGLPEDGLIASADLPAIIYQMSPFNSPYEGNNSLRIENTGETTTIEPVEPSRYQALYFLVTSGSGSAVIETLVHFEDGSSQVFMSQTIPDWYQTGLPVEIAGFGRGDTSNNNVENPSGNPKMFRTTMDIASVNQNKLVTEISITKTSGSGIVNIFAMSGKPAEAICEIPTNFLINNISTTTINISWTEPEYTTNIENYGWVVMLEGETPFEGDHVAEGLVAVGETSTTIDGLEPETTYDVYLVSVCNLDEMFFSDFLAETFTTESLSIEELSFSSFDFYPNPFNHDLYLKAQEAIQKIQIFNLRGQEVFLKESNLTQINIKTENLSAGVYIMKVTISESTKTFKLIKH